MDLLATDTAGNTPLMAAAAAGQPDIIFTWAKEAQRQQENLSVLLAMQNKQGYNLFMLIVLHLNETVIGRVLEAVNLSVCIDQKDNEGLNALLHLCVAEKWAGVELLLDNKHIAEVAIDVHPTDKLGGSALTHTLVAKAKADRQLQNCKVKKEMTNEKLAQKEVDRLWRIVLQLLAKERDLHGQSATTGKDVGVKCIKAQMEGNRKIRTPVPEEVVEEFNNLYKIVFKAKKKPAPPPEPPKPEVKKNTVSSFQQRMNEIYKSAQRENYQKNCELESLKLEKRVEVKEEKKDFSDLEWDCEDEELVSSKPTEIIPVETNGYHSRPVKAEEPVVVVPEPENEPSVDDLRATWRKNRDKDRDKKERKVDEFDFNKFSESLLKKHETPAKSAVVPLDLTDSEDPDLAERMNEEIVWALQQKQEAERLANPAPPQPKSVIETPKPEPTKPKPVERSVKKDPVKSTKEDQLKSDALDFLKMLNKPKVKDEKTRKAEEERELAELEQAINEEISWAYEQKQELEEARNKRLGIAPTPTPQAKSDKEKQIEEEQRKKEAKRKEEEERARKAEEERKRLEKIQREAEAMINKIKKDQELAPPPPKVDNTEDLNNGIADEISWALEQKARAEEEAAKQKPRSKTLPKPEEPKVERFGFSSLKSVKEDNLKKSTSIKDKIEEQKRKEEERLKKFQEEKEKLLNPERKISNTEAKDESKEVNESESQPKSINGVEIIGNGGGSSEGASDQTSLPRWKREKMLREKKCSLDSSSPSPTTTTRGVDRKSSVDASPSPNLEDPELQKLPRWKREKLLRYITIY